MKKLIVGGLAALAILGLVGCGSESAETDEATCGLIEIGQAKYSDLPQGWAVAYADIELQKKYPDVANWEIDDMVRASIHKFCPRYKVLEDIYYANSS